MIPSLSDPLVLARAMKAERGMQERDRQRAASRTCASATGENAAVVDTRDFLYENIGLQRWPP